MTAPAPDLIRSTHGYHPVTTDLEAVLRSGAFDQLLIFGPGVNDIADLVDEVRSSAIRPFSCRRACTGSQVSSRLPSCRSRARSRPERVSRCRRMTSRLGLRSRTHLGGSSSFGRRRTSSPSRCSLSGTTSSWAGRARTESSVPDAATSEGNGCTWFSPQDRPCGGARTRCRLVLLWMTHPAG